MSNSAQSHSIDLNARRKFVKEIGKYAGISFLKSRIGTMRGIMSYTNEFRNGKRGARDPGRAKVHYEAGQLSCGERHVLSFFLGLLEQGKEGTVAPEDTIAKTIRETTGARMAPRTYRRHLASLKAKGWLSVTGVPTGTRFKDHKGKWQTKKVNKITITPMGKFLSLKNPPPLYRPTKPETEGYNQERENASTSLSLLVSDDRNKLERRAPVVTVVSKELPKGNECTRPSPPSSVQTIEQRASRGASRKAANNAAAVRPAVSARRERTGSAKTYRTARRTLLAELFAYLHDDPLRDEMHRVAELQTDPRYPAAMMTALDWDEILYRSLESDWAGRRRIMKNEIYPPLLAFSQHLAPGKTPGAVKNDEDLQHRKAHEELSAWLRVIPDKIPASVPPMVAEQLETERFRLNMLVRQVHAGRVPLSMLSSDDHTLLHYAGLLLGC